MKRWLSILVWAAALPVFSADWRDELTPPQPGAFPPLRPLEADYRFGWGALTAADGSFTFSQPKKGQLELKVNVKTTGGVRAMWRLDAQHTSRCVAATLRPIALQQTEIYKSETDRTTVEFSPEGVVRLRETEPAGKTPSKPKRFKCPDLFDLQTALLFVRSQRLQPGDQVRLVAYPTTAPYLATITVVGRERVKVAGQTYQALKLQLELQLVNRNMTLEPHKKFKQAHAWLSDDKDRLLLKVRAEVFVGSVWAELQSVKYTDSAEGRTTARR